MDTLVTAPSATADPSPTRTLATPPAAALQSMLVHVDGGPHVETRLRFARRVAQRHDATVTAFYAATPFVAQLPVAMNAAISAPAFEIFEQIDRSRHDLAFACVEALRAEPGAPLSWQEARGFEPIRSLARRSLYADLLVLGQHDPAAADSGIPADFVQAVLVESGSPALVLPYVELPKTLGERILVAWKETASSARALRAALPLLQRAKQVHVVAWGTEGTDSDSGALTAFLQHHGIESRQIRSREEPDRVGDRLLSLAVDVSADLMVMGCYGHSRARELVLGGATRTVLRSMTLPVLMAH